MTVAGIVLAAGAGRRFGGPKALAALDGQLFVDRSVGLLRSAGCDPVLAVIGAAADEVRQRSAATAVDWVVADDWADGMSASLRAGLRAAGATAATAACIVLVDQPGIAVDAVRRVAAALGDTGVVAAQARYGDRPGHPVGFVREVWDEVRTEATGDRGARDWLAANAGRVRGVACDGLGSDRDVDRPADNRSEPAGSAG